MLSKPAQHCVNKYMALPRDGLTVFVRGLEEITKVSNMELQVRTGLLARKELVVHSGRDLVVAQLADLALNRPSVELGASSAKRVEHFNPDWKMRRLRLVRHFPVVTVKRFWCGEIFVSRAPATS
jgi:hypothetical protein